MARAPAASGAYVVDLSDGHVVFDDRGREAALGVGHQALHDGDRADRARAARARRRPASSAPGAATARRGTATCTCAAAATSRSAPRRSRATPTARAPASSAWPPTCAVRAPARHRRRVRRRVVLQRQRRRAVRAGLVRRSAVRARLPLRLPPAAWSARSRTARAPRSGSTAACAARRARSRRSGPARFAARGLIRALRDAGISVDGRRRRGDRRPPRRARLAATRSPTVARLVALVNKPSDNYAADSMLRLIGARVAGDGSGAGGARAISRTHRAPLRARARDPRRAPARRSGPHVPARARDAADRHARASRGRGVRDDRSRSPGATARCALRGQRRGGPLPAQGRHARRPEQPEHDAQHQRLLHERERQDVRVRGDDERHAARVRPAGPDRVAAAYALQDRSSRRSPATTADRPLALFLPGPQGQFGWRLVAPANRLAVWIRLVGDVRPDVKARRPAAS